jgi:NACalpha-BTF3-like transcription factor
MENNISLVETSEIEDKIQIILRQTNYTKEIAIQKLKENNFDEIATIKSYLGISIQKKNEIKSVNQEIYKQ